MSCFDESGPLDLVWTSGNTESLIFRYLDSSREPIDLSNFVIKMQLREKVTSLTPPIELFGTWCADGTITIVATSDETKTLLVLPKQKITYLFDIQLSSGSLIENIAPGTITLHHPITR